MLYNIYIDKFIVVNLLTEVEYLNGTELGQIRDFLETPE